MYFCGSHGDWFEDFEELFAAALLAAFFVVCDEASFVTCADLSHFDTAVAIGCEFFDEVAEVDTVFSGEVEDDTVAAEEDFGVDDFHFKIEFFDVFSCGADVLGFGAVEV